MKDIVDIVYDLYKYGMSVDIISSVLGIEQGKVQKYIIDSKLKTNLIIENLTPVEVNILQELISLDRISRTNIILELNEEKLKQLHKELNIFFQLDKNNVEDVMSGLWIIGELKTSKFNTLLKNKSLSYNGNIKRMAISAMGKILDPSFEPYLKQCCKDPKPQVRSYAIKAFFKLQSPDKIQFLEKIYPNETVDYNKKLIEKLLKEG